MSYSRLTLAQRHEIEYFLREGWNQSAIARRLGVHRSTVSNEIRRNGEDGFYLARTAHSLALSRCKRETGTMMQPSGRRPAAPYDVLSFFDKKYFSKDSRTYRLFRFRMPRLDRKKGFYFDIIGFDQQMKRIWLRRNRRRNHSLEGMLRRQRVPDDWLTYKSTGQYVTARNITAPYKRKGQAMPCGLKRGLYQKQPVLHDLDNFLRGLKMPLVKDKLPVSVRKLPQVSLTQSRSFGRTSSAGSGNSYVQNFHSIHQSAFTIEVQLEILCAVLSCRPPVPGYSVQPSVFYPVKNLPALQNA